jgi:RNA polymerase sigma-70 factor (ECF subfamily)
MLTDEIAAAERSEDRELVRALRAGDEQAFARLLERYSGPLLRVAMIYAPSRAVAEEVVQDTWIGVLRGIDRFEGRSTLKTWIFRILTNTAKSRAEREGRTLPFSSLAREVGEDEPSVEPERFLDQSHPAWAGHWNEYPRSWGRIPDERLVSKEIRGVVDAAIATLPESQRTVITLRDVDGFGSEEVCELLGLTEGNQRVLLHRARSKVRRALEEYLDGDEL